VVEHPLDDFDRRTPRCPMDSFRRQMEYLCAFFRPVSLPELLEALDAPGVPPERSVAVTFDDAYYGVYAHAWPILREMGILGAIYVITDYADGSGKRIFSFDEIEIAFRISAAPGILLDFLGLGTVALDSTTARVACMKAVKKRLKLLASETLERGRALLLERLGVTPEECITAAQRDEKYRQANWGQLKEMLDAGWTVGSHTRTHRAVAQVRDEERRSELEGSRQDLERELGLRNIHFAFPYGEPEHIGSDGALAVRAAGYASAVTTIPGGVRHGDDRYLLKRMSFEQLILESPAG
jgi:peptidoglycan/xylan/chitin deacetylase (PgdA/CDA1 family)